MYTFYYTPDNRLKNVSIILKISYIRIRVKRQMEYSKQKLLLSILIKFEESFNKQINESAINQEIGQYIKLSVQELSEKQFRGSLFDKKVDQIVEKINDCRTKNKLVFNDYTGQLWNQILQIKQRTTSFETAYSLIDILSTKNSSLKL